MKAVLINLYLQGDEETRNVLIAMVRNGFAVMDLGDACSAGSGYAVGIPVEELGRECDPENEPGWDHGAGRWGDREFDLRRIGEIYADDPAGAQPLTAVEITQGLELCERVASADGEPFSLDDQWALRTLASRAFRQAERSIRRSP